MAKVIEVFSKVNSSVQRNLKKVQGKPWAEPLGQTLAITGKIVETCVPGAGLIGGALSFGASLLNPEPTLDDLKAQMAEMQTVLQDLSSDKQMMRNFIQNEMTNLQAKIDNPADEIRSDFYEVKVEMLAMMRSIREENLSNADEILEMKDIISKTFDLVTDIKYKVNKCYFEQQVCNLFISSSRIVLNMSVQLMTPLSNKVISRTFLVMPLNCKPMLTMP